MNKGIIIEVKKNYAIALNNSGIMEKIFYKKDMKVGQKIFYFEEDIIKSTSKINFHNSIIKTLGTIAALFLIVFTFFHNMQFTEAYAVVTLDINPSIQMEVDNNKKIVKIEGINDDGKNIDFSNVKGSNINEGIDIIKQILKDKKYFENNREILVAFAFTENKEDAKYEETVIEAIKSSFNTETTITYVKGDKEAVEEAKTKGISLGRYEASLSANEDIKNNIEKVSVKEITSNIKDKLNVIRWEAQDQKVEPKEIEKPIKEDKAPVQEKETKKQTEKTTEKPSKKPINNISDESSKPKNDTISSEQNKNTKKEDNGVLEVFPEKQIKPNDVDDTSKKQETNTSSNNNNENKNKNDSAKNENNDEIQLQPNK